MSFFKKAKLVKENENQTIDILYCYVLMNIGTSFEETNQLDSAWHFFQKSLQVFEKNKIEIIPQLYRHFGNVQFKSGNMPLALDYYRKSLQATNIIKNQIALSAVLLALSEYYQKAKQPDSSIYYAKNALLEAQKISSKNSEIVAAAMQLSKLYENINTNEAFRYYKIAIETKDRLYGKSSLEAIQAIADQEEERQKEIEASRIKYQNQLKQYALLAGLGVFFLIAFILYRNNKKQKKANTLLYQQKEEINQKSKQLENSLSTLKATQSQLIQSEKLASLGELTAGIAHEIQNPLNFVNNFSELSVDLVKDLKEEIDKPEQDKEYIGELFDDLSQNQEKINHHGKRASSIVKGMLEHSRASTGVKELTDINKLADEYLRLSYHGLRAKDNSFNADYELIVDENLPKIEVIPQDIGRVLLNLINNAFYAVNEKNRKNTEGVSYKPIVSVFTQKIDNQITIKVKDNGIGMPEAVRAKVFQPFFTTKPTGQGTGLGLSLAYDIITKGHGGTIEVLSNEGVGSEFIITLPFKTN